MRNNIHNNTRLLIKIYAYVKTKYDVINGNNSSVTTKQDINKNKTSAFRNWIVQRKIEENVFLK